MEQSNTADMVKKVVGVAGGGALIAPVAPPILHGLAGIAVVGAGALAVGALVMKAAQAVGGMGLPFIQKQDGTPSR